ncbi:chaperone modulator CbpM [Lysobacter capsici]|jgi:chaperone modulatory protein CbpM|uniref:chaperone modulator CbpM n=1 Tax=Lysobacter capsici TaxID=435897 RepID=UPI00071FD6BC|nr:chaperone modulator CbpM [Lysobacter capsici]ALN88085.1 merR HTH regulatory family protein [Lysobacter capsici]UOF14418.1 chaperone modulator CbpM [Lysobacter capsici]
MKTIDMAQFLNESTIELHTLERWIEQRWIVPLDATARVEISETDAARAMFIRDLTGDLGVNDEGVAVVLHLVDQLHGLRRALTELRIEMNASRGDPGREAD